MKRILIVIITLFALEANAQDFYDATNNQFPVLKESGAKHFSELALHCIQTEFPNKLGHVITDSSQIKRPVELHPAFYGCFDWHSSVHGHWMLVKILKEFPNLSNSELIRSAISKTITKENIQAEINYLNGDLHNSFERTYGWAWMFQLQNELNTWDDDLGKELAVNLKPLTSLLRDRMIDYLPKLTYPIRTGVHPNTAFALSFAYDYAVEIGDQDFKKVIVARSIDYYATDTNYPAYLEPNGTDFFSPSLLEAELMIRILSKQEYKRWFDSFMPKIPENLLEPAIVSDRTDLSLVHLDGLNISRAWCMLGIANTMDDDNPKKQILLNATNKHLNDALQSVASGNYAGEHWLASFAVYALTRK